MDEEEKKKTEKIAPANTHLRRKTNNFKLNRNNNRKM